MALIYPSDLDVQKNAVITLKPMKWEVKNRESSETAIERTPIGELIVLGIENQISLNESQEWSSQSGAGLSDKFLGSDSLLDKGKELLSGAGIKIAKLGVQQLNNSIGLAASQNALGKIQNDYTALTYSGPGLLSNSFNWTFIPQSSSEARTIAEIIKSIRVHSAPTIKGAYIEYPDIWDIDIKIAGKRIIRYDSCAITNVSTNFNETNKLALSKDGFPMKISLSITINEISMKDRKDIEKDFQL